MASILIITRFDLASLLGGWVARHFFHLPYLSADMGFSPQGDGFHLQSHRAASDVAPAADFAASYKPVGPICQAEKGWLEYFLVERFVVFSVSLGASPIGGRTPFAVATTGDGGGDQNQLHPPGSGHQAAGGAAPAAFLGCDARCYLAADAAFFS